MSVYTINSLKIQFEQVNGWAEPEVPFYYQNCSVQLPNPDYESKCSSKTFTGYNFDTTVNITHLYNQWVTNKQEYGTVIFLHEIETTYNWWIILAPIKIIVEYSLITKNPIDYIEIGKTSLVELALGVEINLTPYEGSLEKGVLTTYVDTVLAKVHQTFMIDGKNYYRCSQKLSNGSLTWLGWEREVKFRVVGDTLFITD